MQNIHSNNTEFYDFYFNFEHQNFTNDYNIQDNFSKLMSPDSNCAYLIMGQNAKQQPFTA